MQLKAHSGHAPLQPKHQKPLGPQQSTNCCSEKLNKEADFFAINTADYKAPVVENDQHDPHDP